MYFRKTLMVLALFDKRDTGGVTRGVTRRIGGFL